jgi:hypothetical protein
MTRRLFILGQDPPELARNEGVSLDELAAEFGEDLELMADLGWGVEDAREAVDLTMSADRLAKTIKRLRRDARCAPCEPPREHEPKEADGGRWKRFREVVDTCEELLDLLDHRGGGEAEIEAEGLVDPPNITILAAVERAARHERSDAVSTAAVIEHLGHPPEKAVTRPLRGRLDNLRDAGYLTRAARDGGESWLLTTEGREHLHKSHAAGEVGELPESPQHRAWRAARVLAAVRIGEFEGELGTVLEEASDLLNKHGRPHSSEWFALSERLSPVAWRLGSATHCLLEWVEPEDDFPDEDENPGPHPGRRTMSAWDQPTAELGGKP